MSKAIRTIKNVTKGYSATQVKVRNATSNDPWGPTGAEMSDIARMTFDTELSPPALIDPSHRNHDFFEIMDMLDRRLNDKGRNWRHVLKALKVLDYCLHEGSAHVVVWAKDNIYIIKTLREFQYIDEDGRDQGANVRTAAKELTQLILDEERLRAERKDRKTWKSRVTGLEEGISSDGTATRQERPQKPRQQRRDEDDVEYRLAIEASKNLAEEEEKRNRDRQNETDSDLEKAIKLSKEEEELRQRELANTNDDSIFDAAPQAQSQNQQQPFPQPGFDQQQQQPYQQMGSVDLFGNPIPQQPTAVLQNVYAQPGFDPNQQQQYQQGPTATGWGPSTQFPQPGAFDQSNQPQFAQQQPTGFGNSNPYSNNLFPQNQLGGGLQPNPQQGPGFQQPGDQNPYSKNTNNQDAIKPMPTGSNNPFAQFTNTSSFGSGNNVTPQRQGPPSLNQIQQQQQTQQQQQQAQHNTLQPVQENTATNFASSFQQQPQPTAADVKHSHLNAVLARGNESGQDTFGNVGDLRIPAQHTAPGTFFNSAGAGRTGQAGAGGNNPFFNQQFTGAQQQQFGSSMQPAQTGPANVNGFGGGQQYGQPQQGQQSNNLIDF